MTLIQPFRGLRPPPHLAREISAPPYDVISRQEAKELALGHPCSFLHVSRAEINLPDQVTPHDPLVYATAQQRLQRMITSGQLLLEASPCLYFYRLTMAGRQQLGLVAAASVAAYQSGRIKKHEFTRPDKEEDRTRLAESLQAHSGPVFLIHRPSSRIQAAMTSALAVSECLYDFTGDDGIGHTFWRLADRQAMAELVEAFEALPGVYIADGHHRSAAAVRVCEKQWSSPHPPSVDAPVNRFLSVLFPADQVKILDYNRIVRDLHGYSTDDFLEAIRSAFTIQAVSHPVKPEARHHFGLYLRERGWFTLALRPALHPNAEILPQERLDVSLLSRHLLEPILGIHDPRRDSRIDFVGGIRGMEGLVTQVHANGMAAGFSLFPPDLEDLMQVADAGEVMPPKSTWFEPKLRDGLIVQPF
ncbi:MAG: DUF1015 domain-containing protein [Magnetococcales bacterium]|nr:DUF1015 domain-containing protein [Magnetococcales bacterium]